MLGKYNVNYFRKKRKYARLIQVGQDQDNFIEKHPYLSIPTKITNLDISNFYMTSKLQHLVNTNKI